jgi:hypothetical protein
MAVPASTSSAPTNHAAMRSAMRAMRDAASRTLDNRSIAARRFAAGNDTDD